MAQRQTTTEDSGTTRTVPFRYTPGDGHVYTWDGGSTINVYRVRDILPVHGLPVTRVTPAPVETIDVSSSMPRTASAFVLAVDDWRAAR